MASIVFIFKKEPLRRVVGIQCAKWQSSDGYGITIYTTDRLPYLFRQSSRLIRVLLQWRLIARWKSLRVSPASFPVIFDLWSLSGAAPTSLRTLVVDCQCKETGCDKTIDTFKKELDQVWLSSFRNTSTYIYFRWKLSLSRCWVIRLLSSSLNQSIISFSARPYPIWEFSSTVFSSVSFSLSSRPLYSSSFDCSWARYGNGKGIDWWIP